MLAQALAETLARCVRAPERPGQRGGRSTGAIR